MVEPSSLGFIGISWVLLQSCCKELVAWMLLAGGEVPGSTLHCSQSPTSRLQSLNPASAVLPSVMELAITTVGVLVLHCLCKKQRKEDCFEIMDSVSEMLCLLPSQTSSISMLAAMVVTGTLG